MEDEPQTTNVIETLGDVSTSTLNWAVELGEMLTRTWSIYQLGITLALILVAWFLTAFTRPRLRAWLHTREGWPKWRLRLAAVISRRLPLIFFVLVIWAVVLVMEQVTWPSRSRLLGVFANLSTAWLVVALATRLIGNAIVRTVVRYGAWIWVTLNILGLTDQTVEMLDKVALSIGETRWSLWLVLQAIVILVVLMLGARFISRIFNAAIRDNRDISPSMQVLAVKIIQVILYSAAFFIGLRAVGVDLTGLAVLSGAIGIGVGFGLQKVVSNLVSGLIILLDKSIKPGDVITIGETFGWVDSLTARYVSITTRDGREYLVPNEDLITGQVVNWSHTNRFVRLDINFGTSYGSDPHEVRRLAIEAAAGCERVLSHKPPVCHIVGFGDSSVDYVLRFWITDPSDGLTNIRGNVFLALWDTFQEHNIAIPFPQREVRLLGDDGPAIPVADT